MACHFRAQAIPWLSESLDPGPNFDLKGPGAARLAQHLEIGVGDGIGIERAVRPIRWIGPPRAAHPTIDNEMGDMDALGPQLARRALRQATQGKLAHRERRGERVALDAGTGAGQQDGALSLRNHPAGGLLDNQKAAKRRYLDRFAHRFRVDLGDRAVRSRAGVVEHDIRRPEPRVDFLEQMRDGRRVRGIDSEPFRTGLGGERRQLFDIAAAKPAYRPGPEVAPNRLADTQWAAPE